MTSIRVKMLLVCMVWLNASCDLFPGVAGERVDGCPPNETCSEQVTQLYFSGATLGDQPVFPPGHQVYATAMNGTQEITVWRDAGNTKFDQPVTAPPGTVSVDCLTDMTGRKPPFCAQDGEQRLISLSSNPPAVTVTGKGAGQDDLLIMAPYCQRDTDGHCNLELYDGVRLDVVEVDSVRVGLPRDAALLASGYPSLFAQLHDYHMDSTPIAFAHGSQPPAVVIGLFGTAMDGAVTRAVDTSQPLLVDGASQPALNRIAWDSLAPAGRFNSDIAVDVGRRDPMTGDELRATIRVVDYATEIQRVAGTGSHVLRENGMLTPGTFAYVCFSPYYKDGGDRYLIHGAWLSFDVTPSETAVTRSDTPPLADSCIGVVAHKQGCVRISVNYGDVKPSSFSVPAGSLDACSMAARLP